MNPIVILDYLFNFFWGLLCFGRFKFVFYKFFLQGYEGFILWAFDDPKFAHPDLWLLKFPFSKKAKTKFLELITNVFDAEMVLGEFNLVFCDPVVHDHSERDWRGSRG